MTPQGRGVVCVVHGFEVGLPERTIVVLAVSRAGEHDLICLLQTVSAKHGTSGRRARRERAMSH